MESVFYSIVKIAPKLEIKNNNNIMMEKNDRLPNKFNIEHNKMKQKKTRISVTNYSNKKLINHDAQLNAEHSHTHTDSHQYPSIDLC